MTDYVPTNIVLLRAIVEAPDDDAPRMAYADWLDNCDGDTPEAERDSWRARLIRAMCRDDRAFRRWLELDKASGGFTTEQLEEFRWAFSQVDVTNWDRGFTKKALMARAGAFFDGPYFLRKNPPTRIELTDAIPSTPPLGSDIHLWVCPHRRSAWTGQAEGRGAVPRAALGPNIASAVIPGEWFGLLATDRVAIGPTQAVAAYDTPEEAQADLNQAVTAWARERSGLFPPGQWPRAAINEDGRPEH